jgi:hypothetical protein
VPEWTVTVKAGEEVDAAVEDLERCAAERRAIAVWPCACAVCEEAA